MGNYDATYWDRYYGEQTGHFSTPAPSQFAAFVLDEVSKNSLIIDAGCGNGRDAIFFAKFGHKVIGIDASQIAIDVCKKASKAFEVEAKFMCEDVGFDEFIGKIVNDSSYASSTDVLVYARFFLHAITELQEEGFLKAISTLSNNKKVLVALEFRTAMDQTLPKVTDEHYRRFIDPTSVISRFQKAGFDVEYFVEGFGFAKHRSDDAHVARLLLKTGG